MPSRRTSSPAVVLLSGGLDSAVCLAAAARAGHACHAVSFDYGQRHRAELAAARRVAGAMGAASHTVVRVDLGAIGGSALTDRAIGVPMHRSARAIGRGVPVTYVPARNLVFLSIAAAQAEVLGARDIYIGVNALDYSGYPDCRGPFIRAFQRAANLGTRAGTEGGAPLRIRTPLLRLTKAGIVRLAVRLDVPLHLTVSCYTADTRGRACGACDACLLRRRGFMEAGVADPTRYSKGAR